ncbi:hypothetical protein ACH3XW_8355 [Acanthocheilonema viteae]
MARIICLLLLPSMISAMLTLPGQIPYWAGGASTGSLFGNSLIGTNQQLSNLGLLGGLGGLQSFGGLQGLSGLQGLGGLQGLSGLQAIQMPYGSNMYPCMPCIICSPQNTPTNCMPTPKPAPFNGQFCCCCTPTIGSGIGSFNGKK